VKKKLFDFYLSFSANQALLDKEFFANLVKISIKLFRINLGRIVCNVSLINILNMSCSYRIVLQLWFLRRRKFELWENVKEIFSEERKFDKMLRKYFSEERKGGRIVRRRNPCLRRPRDRLPPIHSRVEVRSLQKDVAQSGIRRRFVYLLDWYLF
jgi:hypothetical protein